MNTAANSTASYATVYRAAVREARRIEDIALEEKRAANLLRAQRAIAALPAVRGFKLAASGSAICAVITVEAKPSCFQTAKDIAARLGAGWEADQNSVYLWASSQV
jgi:hypothetical protein